MQKHTEAVILNRPEITRTRARTIDKVFPVCRRCGLELHKNYKANWFCLECNISFADTKLLLHMAEEEAEFLTYSKLSGEEESEEEFELESEDVSEIESEWDEESDNEELGD
jgi:hypothetical protein